MEEMQITALVNAGANRWQKGGHDRLYIKGIAMQALDLDIDYYKTGNIRSASVLGDRVSNCEGGRILGAITGMYIDCKTGKIKWYGQISDDYISVIREYIDEIMNKE